MTIRILLVDDHQMMRDGLRAILASDPRVEVVGEAENGRTAVELVRKLQPELVVMDVGMEQMNGIEATRKICAEFPDVRVIALSTHSDKRYVANMLKVGASGYVLKEAAFEDLHRAVEAVSAGKSYLSPEITGLVMGSYVGKKPPRENSAYSILGAREREVLQLLAEGKTSPEIGTELSIATKTVETHRRNIMKKLELHSVAQLTKYAVREGLTSLEG